MKTKSNRIKLISTVITTRAEMEALVGEITALTLTRNKQQIEMDQAITKIREGYEDTMGQLDKQLAEKTEVARAWAEANPAEFKGLKSLDLVHATVGWRTGQPQLKTLAGWTWDRVLEKLKALSFTRYIRTKEDVDKQGILADRHELAGDDLRNMGVRVIQEESFYIDPKIAEQENRATVAAAA